MITVYAYESPPHQYSKSVFLAGPTPRTKNILDSPYHWRNEMIHWLENAGYDGVVFIPEGRDGTFKGQQEAWEIEMLDRADLILTWVPRQLPEMPAFTTNVEFGRYLHSNRMLYGRPAIPMPLHTKYLDWSYAQLGLTPSDSIQQLAFKAVKWLGDGWLRKEGETAVPLQIWKTPMFQDWYKSQTEAGNRLDAAKVLWTFVPPSLRKENSDIFSYAIHVNVWIEEEKRNKVNEFILSRKNISCIMPYKRADDLLDTKIVLIKEYRSPANTKDGFVHELPGGSAFADVDVLQLAAEELHEETGLKLHADRFHPMGERQMVATLSTHLAALYSVELTEKEMAHMESLDDGCTTFGEEGTSEKTYIEIRTIKQLLSGDQIDWAMMGMIMKGIMNLL